MRKGLAVFAAGLLCLGLAVGSYAGERDLEAEKAAFLEDLSEDGYAEVGTYKVELIKEGVYHMDEGIQSNPGGDVDENGVFHNPSSMYFVDEGEEVLMVDNGNPAQGDAEMDAKVIVEAMTAGKPLTILYTHSHGDHTGLALSGTVFENVDVVKAYIGEPDLETGKEAIAQFLDITETLADGDSFTVGGNEYTAYIVNAHTDGSLMVVDKAHEVLFTGDTFGSGFVWAFFEIKEGNPLANLSAGVAKARDILNGMESPSILAGHRWQQFWEANAQRPNEMSIQYFNDMAQVINGLMDGTTLQEDYSAWEGAVELSSNGAKAKVDTLPSIIEDYMDSVYKMDQAYVYSAAPTLSIETVNAVAAPGFIVYPDGALSDEEAQALLDETGISAIVERSASTAYVARPANGESFTEEDLAGFAAIAGRIYVSENLKVVGFGNGASFVNQYLSKYANIFSGVLVCGGEAGGELSASVPAYVSGSAEAAAAYLAADKAEEVSSEGGLTTYVNPESRFELVVVNEAEETPAEAFQNGWTQVLGKFGRIGNYIETEGAVGTWYSRPIITGDDAVDTTRIYQYFDTVDLIDNITRYVVTEDLNGSGTDSLWYEYVPDAAAEAEAGTVPVVFLMHGNTNDPRTQYDTSGWAKIASEEGLILVCPEWQGHTYQGYTYEPMTEDSNATPDADFVKVIEKVLEKYPQADASRVYISGLSAGCMNTTNNCLSNTKYFAAGAGQSGPFGFALSEQHAADIALNKDAYDVPIIYFTGDRDEYLMADFDILEPNGGFRVLQMFEELNDMPVTSEDELSEENLDLYAVPWTERYVIEANAERVATILGGVVKNEKGVEICMNRICGWGHWNYAPDAPLMWEFMKKYSRDPESGEIVIAQ